MKVRFKMLAVAMAVLTLLLCMAVPIQAAVVEPDVEPNWQNTATITLTLNFPDDDGYASASICGQPGVTKIVIDIYVYRQIGDSWALVREKHSPFNSSAGTVGCSFNAIKRAYYKAHYIFTVTKNNIDEIFSETQYRTCS